MAKAHPNQRLQPMMDADFVSGLDVIVVGAGRVGSGIIRELATLPIRKIIAVDHDTLSAKKDKGTAMPGGFKDRYKARLWQRFVELWNPKIEFEAVLMKVGADTRERFASLVQQADLLFWAADDWPALRLLNPIFHDSVRAVGVAMSELGAYAEIVWSIPGARCLSCGLDVQHRESLSGEASLQLDVNAVANLAVSCGLGLCLIGRHGFELYSELVRPGNQLLIVHNRNNNFTNSANSLVPRLVKTIPVNRGCRVCNP